MAFLWSIHCLRRNHNWLPFPTSGLCATKGTGRPLTSGTLFTETVIGCQIIWDLQPANVVGKKWRKIFIPRLEPYPKLDLFVISSVGENSSLLICRQQFEKCKSNKLLSRQKYCSGWAKIWKTDVWMLIDTWSNLLLKVAVSHWTIQAHTFGSLVFWPK